MFTLQECLKPTFTLNWTCFKIFSAKHLHVFCPKRMRLNTPKYDLIQTKKQLFISMTSIQHF